MKETLKTILFWLMLLLFTLGMGYQLGRDCGLWGNEGVELHDD